MLLRSPLRKSHKKNKNIDLSKVKIACQNEFFHEERPFFVAVEPFSRYCFFFSEGVSCSESDWTKALNPLKNKGYDPAYIVAENGIPLMSGINNILPGTPFYWDVFHLCRELGQAVFAFRKNEQRFRSSVKDVDERIKRFKFTRAPCDDDTFGTLYWLNYFLGFMLMP